MQVSVRKYGCGFTFVELLIGMSLLLLVLGAVWSMISFGMSSTKKGYDNLNLTQSISIFQRAFETDFRWAVSEPVISCNNLNRLGNPIEVVASPAAVLFWNIKDEKLRQITYQYDEDRKEIVRSITGETGRMRFLSGLVADCTMQKVGTDGKMARLKLIIVVIGPGGTHTHERIICSSIPPCQDISAWVFNLDT